MAVTPFGVETGILYRLTGPDGITVSFNDSSQADFVGFTEEVSGLDGPDTRESAELIVEGDGGIHGDFFHGRRPIVLSGIIDPNQIGAARNVLISNLLRATNAMRADATLSWTPTGGDPVAVKVRRQQPPRIAGQRLKTFQISLVAADPRLYGAAARSFSRGSEAAPSGWGHAASGEYDSAAMFLGPAELLTLGSSGGLSNRGSYGSGGDGAALGGITIGAVTGALARGDNTATDFDGTNDSVLTGFKTRRNFVLNWNFNVDTSSWVTQNASVSRITTDSAYESACARVTTDGTAGAGIYTYAGGYLSQALTGGLPYTAWCYVKANSGADVGWPVQMVIAEQNSAGAVLNFHAGPVLNLTSSWQQMSCTANFSAGGVNAYMWPRAASASGGLNYLVGGAVMEQSATTGGDFPISTQLGSGEAGWMGTPNASVSDIGCFANGTTRTFAGWATRDSSGANHTLIGSDNALAILRIDSGGNNVSFFPDGNYGGQTWTGAWPGSDQWVHWALVFNEVTDSATLYINGAAVSTKTSTVKWGRAPNLVIGARGFEHFDGKMRSVAVFYRALSAHEIKWLYEEGTRAMAFNRGNADSPVVMRITGPITNPTIYNQTTGQSMSFTAAITGGNWIEIDTGTGEIVNQAGANVYSMMNFTTSNWWDLKPGVNDFYLVGTGTSGATSLTLTYKDAWV